jgi:prepilin-type N-terminal cleavage/methylation domain-containing protein
MKKSKGFTLVELLVVVIIIFVLAVTVTNIVCKNFSHQVNRTTIYSKTQDSLQAEKVLKK